MKLISIRTVKIGDCLLVYDRIYRSVAFCKVLHTNAYMYGGGIQQWTLEAKQYVNYLLYDKDDKPNRLSVMETDHMPRLTVTEYADTFLLDDQESMLYVHIYEL